MPDSVVDQFGCVGNNPLLCILMTLPRKIKDEETLWEHFEAYRKEVKGNPFEVHDFVGGAGKEVLRKKEKCLTMQGFRIYLHKNKILANIWEYIANKDGEYDDLKPMLGLIKDYISHDRITGGMAGVYSPQITMRLEGLVEKSAVEVTDVPLFPDVKGNAISENDSNQ